MAHFKPYKILSKHRENTQKFPSYPQKFPFLLIFLYDMRRSFLMDLIFLLIKLSKFLQNRRNLYV